MTRSVVSACASLLLALLLTEFASAQVVGVGARTMDGSATVAGRHRVVVDTSDHRITKGEDNQAWWSHSGLSTGTGGNYAVGQCVRCSVPERLRNFFTFDISGIDGRVVAATLVVKRYGSSKVHQVETYKLSAVRTHARRLNTRLRRGRAIYRDLGLGVSYGTYKLSTDAPRKTKEHMKLVPAAVRAINKAQGRYFSIGGKVTSLTKKHQDELLFKQSGSQGTQRLVLTVK